MDGRGNYRKKEKEISSLISQYASVSRMNRSKVIYCFDCDDFDKKQEDSEFLKAVQQYCEKKGHEFVWFCKDVECVYLGRTVEDSQKRKKQSCLKLRN